MVKELTREEVQTRLTEKGHSQKDVADISEQLVCMVIAGTRISQRIVNVISLLLGEDISIKRNKQLKKVKRIHINRKLEAIEDITQYQIDTCLIVKTYLEAHPDVAKECYVKYMEAHPEEAKHQNFTFQRLT